MSQVTEKGNFAALLRTSPGLLKDKKYTSAETAWMVRVVFFFVK
jgi:uncharacterized membrane protein